VADRRASGRDGVLLFEESGTNVAMQFTATLGDADAAFRDAPYVRRERFQTQRYTALPMEPRGVLAEWDGAQRRMTVLGAAKVPFFNRDTLAAMLGLSPGLVDLTPGSCSTRSAPSLPLGSALLPSRSSWQTGAPGSVTGARPALPSWRRQAFGSISHSRTAAG
jgi:hypothetical protein